MGRHRSLTSRFLLAGIVLVVTFVLGVGAIDLVLGTTFFHGRASGGPRMAMTDRERVAAAAKNKGPFAAPTDPNVGITMIRGATRRIVDADAVLDDYGQRTRRGPPAAPGAKRIVILGDSVAFGFGLPNDQTIAHHLEQHLAAAVGADGPRPVVHTIACPGWTQTNAFRFLLNHLARLAPDIVIFLPIGNDLHDAYTVIESGHRSVEYDPVRGAAEPHTSAEQWNLLMMANYAGASAAALMRLRAAGGVNKTVAHAVMTGLTPESKRRWRIAADEVRELDNRLRAHGCKLALGFSVYEEYMNLYQAEVGTAAPDVPIFWTFETFDRLPNDPHPNEKYAAAAANCFARELIAKGWLANADAARLPALGAGYAERRLQGLSLDEAKRRAAAQQQVWAEFFGPDIVIRTTEGFHQVYGAVYGDGTVNRCLWFALRNPAKKPRIRLEIERLAQDSGVYPLAVDVSVNGAAAGRIEIPAPTQAPGFTFAFDVPRSAANAEFLDVRIQPTNWVAQKHEGTTRMASFTLVRAGME